MRRLRSWRRKQSRCLERRAVSPGASIYARVALCSSDGAPRFITEKFRQHVAFRPRYGRGGSKTRSEDALTIGRKTDHAFQKCVDAGTIPAEGDRSKVYARNALLALKAAGVRPVRTQLPVRFGCVGTRLDGIGVMVRNGAPVVVILELKTTGRDPTDAESYDAVCSLLPTLHIIGLANSERTSHDIQAEVGRLGFIDSYPALARFRTVSAVVLASERRATVRFVDRLSSEGPPIREIFQHVRLTGPSGSQRFQRLPSVRDGGGIIRRALKEAGLVVKTTGPRVPKSASFICASDGAEIVCGLRVRWTSLSGPARKRDEDAIRRTARDRPAGIVFRDGNRWKLHRV